MQKIKTITSHVGLSRFLAQCDQLEDDGHLYIAGWLPNFQMPAVDRYSYAPAYAFYFHNDRAVHAIEVSHKRYEIWECPLNELYLTEDAAVKAHLEARKSA